ncbi:CpsD/CapB family tyrosine-protein kinase [Pararhizobium sp. BT-229]|uniref:CpsD/CapB family tyrosine-protein kinase n=1 Tax=Pararhizobium sp. BT-229 TaxID=2986923 RepID=UPI0021F75AB9|nr:CpsD/CapB family tyrosine-protein kinase [Pararhizobium sp. BT-229]MCV9967692.1 CpsD/CapB family tyrosine-protein kinase [Pararhizobium sp. BT-229]
MDQIRASLQDSLRLQSGDQLAEQAMQACTRIGFEIAWGNLATLEPDPDTTFQNRIVTIDRSDPAHAPFDMMRTRVLQTLRQNSWTSIAITSPTASCGKSLVALNLAFSLAHQQDCRTLLVDLNLKQPRIGKMLGVNAPASMEDYLKGDAPIHNIFQRYGENLAVGTNHQPVLFSAELLQSAEATRVLQDLRLRMGPDVILFDMPPMLSSDDVTAFLPNVDCAILVAAAEVSTFDEVDNCERYLSERTNMLGVVLNKCEYCTDY